ncbi:MAG: hypothetical protein QM751_00645 [Paludibacteraceae bacterium]
MKRLKSILWLCAISSATLVGQLKVANNGNVGIQLGTTTPLSSLSIGDVGDVNTKLKVVGNTNGIVSKRDGEPDYSWTYSILGHSELHSLAAVGVRGQAFSYSPQNQGKSWGVFGLAGNSTTGWNYGVLGTLYGSQNGAGVVGTTSDQGPYIDAIYAGYFVGNVKITGLVNGTLVGNSDKRYKTNI